MPGENTKSARRLARQHLETPRTSIGNIFDTQQQASIQDRILQWQAQGVAALAPDAVSVVSAPRTDDHTSLLASRPQTPIEAEAPAKTDDRTPRGRHSRRLAEAEQEEWIRKGRASTPKKRVVSDDHWRKLKTKSNSPNHIESSPLTVNHTPLVNKGDKGDRVARAEREERRRRRAAARATKAQTPSPEIQPRRKTLELDFDVRSNVGNRTGHDSDRDDFSIGQCEWGSLPDRDGDDILINNPYAATLGRPPECTPSSPSNMKSRMLNKTREILGINETTAAATRFVTSIDAWLEDQKEPFIDIGDIKASPDRNRKQKRHKERIREPSKTSFRDQPPQTIAHEKNPHGRRGDDKPDRERNCLPLPDLSAVTTITTSDSTEIKSNPRVSRSRRNTVSLTSSRNTTTDYVGQANKPSPENLQIKTNDIEDHVKTSSVDSEINTKPLVLTDAFVHDRHSHTLKRQLTTHEDLMSELSKPGRPRRSRRTRSTRPTRNQEGNEAVQLTLASMKEDEIRYTKELRTLVDGVIPVLLQSVLSKKDTMATAALFTMFGSSDEQNISKPIIDMGIALERLKSLHNRLVFSDVEKLLSWCQTAHRAYSDYLKAWRLGFQDVIVNLAPIGDEKDEKADIMARDNNGDVVDADGEKVDVAYLLKRPLVKIKKMSKTLNDLASLLKDHVIAQRIAEDYNELTAQARRKHQQEQGRLEDEAAAQTDATKTRDIRTLGTLPGVVIEKGHRVRARDMFNLSLQHSSGQRVDCKVELIIRDNTQGDATGGDVLVCQVDEAGKWLLFAPVSLANISARKDTSEFDLVVMIRGHADLRTEWHELLALQAEDETAAADWLNMLGSNPLPPKLNHVELYPEETPQPSEVQPEGKQALTAEALAKVASLEDFDIPLGEPSVVFTQPPTLQFSVRNTIEKPLPKLNLGGGLRTKTVPQSWPQQSAVPRRKPVASSLGSPKQPRINDASPQAISKPNHSPNLTVKSEKHNEEKSQLSYSMASTQSYTPRSSVLGTTTVSEISSSNITSSSFANSASSATSHDHSQLSTRNFKHVSLAIPEEEPTIQKDHRRIVSFAEGSEEIVATKIAAKSSYKSFSSTPLTETLRGKWALMSGWGKKQATVSETTDNVPVAQNVLTIDVPKPPEHRTRNSLPSLSNPLLVPDPILVSDKETVLVERKKPLNISTFSLPDRPAIRSKSETIPSSPLRIEYAASTATETAEEDDFDSADESSSSDTSEDLNSEMRDDLKSLPDMQRRRPMSKPPSAWKTAPSTIGTQTLAPSDSASQGPYRSVPPSSANLAARKEWCPALVCTWSDKGSWEPLCDEECAIVITPGLIEAFSISQLNSLQGAEAAPLVAYELTPIVPLRKGTALDITIRSPSTASSRIKTTSNVMFRSRSYQDCNKLYYQINWARCNNPTYMELERARPKIQPVVTFGTQQPERARSWFSFGGPRRQNSYRAKSMPPSVADTANTTGSTSKAMSALRRFSKSSTFSINRSSVVHRPGLGTAKSSFSAGGSSTSGVDSSVPAPPTQVGFIPGKDGPNVPGTSMEAIKGGGMVNNMLIRLHLRQGQGWKALGYARLSVLPAPVVRTPVGSRPGSAAGRKPEDSSTMEGSRRVASMPGTPRREYRLPSSSHTPHRFHGDGREKRILVTDADRPEIVLVDEMLAEACFEKIAERGIAIKVWTEEEIVRHRGSVLTGTSRLYMLQFKTGSEASWVFGLMGTYRYGYVGE